MVNNYYFYLYCNSLQYLHNVTNANMLSIYRFLFGLSCPGDDLTAVQRTGLLSNALSDELSEAEFVKWLETQNQQSSPTSVSGGCVLSELPTPPPEDPFWEVFTPPEIVKASDCVTDSNGVNSKMPNSIKLFDKIFGPELRKTIYEGVHIEVRGNGYCGVNSLIAHLLSMCIVRPDVSYDVLKEKSEWYLRLYGFTEKNPSVIDVQYVCCAMAHMCCDFNLLRSTIVVIDIDNNALNMNSLLSDNEPSNTFLLIYSSGHYNALFVEESVRIQVFHRLRVLKEELRQTNAYVEVKLMDYFLLNQIM